MLTQHEGRLDIHAIENALQALDLWRNRLDQYLPIPDIDTLRAFDLIAYLQRIIDADNDISRLAADYQRHFADYPRWVNPLRVIIGAGQQTYAGWIATQKEQLDLLDRTTWEAFFGERRADALLCEHVWEHLTLDEGKAAATLCYEYLRDGGRLRVAVPDGNFPDPAYQRLARAQVPPDHPAADHKTVYDYHLIREVFEGAGFVVDVLEYCDEDGRFHYNHWEASQGMIYRSLRFDHRNTGGTLGFVSLIIDAIKPRT